MTLLLILAVNAMAVQLITGLIITMANVVGFNETKRNNYRGYASDTLRQKSKWVKIGVLAMVASPLALLTVPVLVVFGIFYGIKKAIESVVPAFTYSGDTDD